MITRRSHSVRLDSDRALHYGEHLQFSGPSYRLKGRKLEWEESATPLNK